MLRHRRTDESDECDGRKFREFGEEFDPGFDRSVTLWKTETVLRMISILSRPMDDCGFCVPQAF